MTGLGRGEPPQLTFNELTSLDPSEKVSLFPDWRRALVVWEHWRRSITARKDMHQFLLLLQFLERDDKLPRIRRFDAGLCNA